MDKGTQKEMGRLTKFTKRQKRDYVDRMIASRLNGSTVISSFGRMPELPLPPPPKGKKKDIYIGSLIEIENPIWSDPSQAEQYYTHLVSIVTRACPPDGKAVFAGIHSIDEAYEQLWISFNRMRPDIETPERILTDTDNRLKALETQVSSLQKVMDKRDQATEKVLKLLLAWKRKHEANHKKSGFIIKEGT